MLTPMPTPTHAHAHAHAHTHAHALRADRLRESLDLFAELTRQLGGACPVYLFLTKYDLLRSRLASHPAAAEKLQRILVENANETPRGARETGGRDSDERGATGETAEAASAAEITTGDAAGAAGAVRDAFVRLYPKIVQAHLIDTTDAPQAHTALSEALTETVAQHIAAANEKAALPPARESGYNG